MTARPTATSAASTAFCCDTLVGPLGQHLWLDGNGKITAGNGTLDMPRPNAFSLAHIEDCPGSTSVCRAACYVHGLAKHAPATYDLYRHNSRAIREILAGPHVHIWTSLLGAWISNNCPGGFRWHVSGDVFSLAYAAFIADVCRWSKGTPHWIYTRSFEMLGPLLDVATVNGGNLAINLSADSENYDQADALQALYGLRLCYMATDSRPLPVLADGDVIFPDYTLRGGNEAGQAWFGDLSSSQKKMVCPVDFHGKAENRRCGPCDKCLT